MKRTTILSLVTATLLITSCGAEEKNSMETVNSVKTEVKKSSTNSAVTDIKKIANEKPKEEITKTEPKVEKKVENKSKAKVEIIQKIDSIGEKKTVGEIITAAISQIKDLAENKDNKTKSKATDAFDYKLKPKKVADNVWCFFGALEPPTKKNAGNMANNCYIKTKDSYVLMDTGPSYQFALQAYNAMKKIADLPVSHIIISHEHDDHWLGNDFYKKKFNAKIIGPASINRDYKDGVPTRMFNILPKNAIEGTHIIKVDESPKEKTSIVVGGEKFDIIPMDTKAHTGDDIFLYMPERKILFAGDLVMNGRITSGRDGSVMGELKAIAMMKKLDWKIMIPGHGFITDSTAMDEAEMYFKLTKERVLKAIDEGVDATEINEVVKLIEFKDKAMYDILNAHNVGFAFDELEMLED